MMRWWLMILVCALVLGLPAASSAAEGGGGPLEFKKDLAIWTGFVFLVLFIVLRVFAWKPIAEGLEKREGHIADNIAAAERQNKEARRLLGEHQKKLDQVQDEVREIMEEARRDARHTQEEILAKAREEAQRERDRAIRDIDLATQAAGTGMPRR